MASELDVLLDKVEDPALRADLKRQVELLRARRRFGLVFEEHLPERVQLPEHAIRRGTRVVRRDHDDDEPREVLKVAKKKATVRDADGDIETLAVDDLVVVADFGEPIYPGLRRLGSLRAGGDKPAHVVIKGENHHVLEALQFTHAGKVDCIYIDPPYNNGKKDWKYDNRYIDDNDGYRHSKWLAFMQRRLRLAKDLLRPDESVLLVTVDEKEHLRLGLLLEQVFSGCTIQTITSVINPKGASLGQDFARVDEHIFVVFIGSVGVQAEVRDMLDERKNEAASRSVKWSSLIRGGAQGIRTDSPGAYYPVFVDPDANTIHSFGAPLPWGAERDDVTPPDGTLAVWPPQHTTGVEGRWGIGPDKARELLALGALRLGKVDPSKGKFPLSYLSAGIMEKVASGEIITVGRKHDGSLIVEYPPDTKVTQPKTVWRMQSHNAGEYGTKLITSLLPGRKFPYPKSLYAVEDTLGFFIRDKPNAVVLDFFGGSGTTTHAVARLNRRDGGRRQSILVTNNEVSAGEAGALTRAGHSPGDPQWEAVGIFEHITRPRIVAAVTGETPNGEPIDGEYKFMDEFPMSEGLAENVEFFELTYLDPEDVEISAAFAGTASLLWLRAGGRGEMIEHDAPYYAVMETYGVLFNPDRWRKFVSDLHDEVRTVFIVTDSPSTFAAIASELPVGVEAVRLYENYLSTFALNTRRTMPVEESSQ